MKLTIEITQEDIDQGVRGNCRYCPVAVAMSRATGRSVVCTRFGYSIDCDGFLPLPETASDFIMDFDLGFLVHPFSFEVAEASTLAAGHWVRKIDCEGEVKGE